MPSIPNRLPQYQNLYETLRQELRNGLYPIGSLLPSENDLQQKYNLTQPTVRQALSMLAEEGYIKKFQGKGSVVQPIPTGLGMLAIQPHQICDTFEQANIRTEIVQKPIIRSFPTDFSFAPSTDQTAFYYFERLRLVNEEVVFFEKIAFSASEISHFQKQTLENRSFFEVLNTAYHIIIKGGEEKVWTTLADATLMAVMRVKEGTPILRLEKQIETNRPHLMIYSSLYACTDKYLLQGRF